MARLPRICRTGTLWEGRFKSCVVDSENHVLNCQRYIELNPVRANMVSDPGNYAWSSYRSNGPGKPAKLWTPHEVYLGLGISDKERILAYQDLFKTRLEGDVLRNIRESVNKGLALGDQCFKDEIEKLTGRRVTPEKPGPRKQIERNMANQKAQEFLL